MTTKTYYNFNYDKVSQVMLDHIPAILREIELMTDGIMNAHGEQFIGDDESPTGQGHYVNTERHREATLETTRLLISWLFNCLPPVLDESAGEYFILPDELTTEHAREHFADLASNGYDQRKRMMDDLWDKYSHLSWDKALDAIKAEIEANNG